ncbi:chromatin assembly factor 1 subunit A-domain-containing protein [Pelagophyceae sp. CCMP2097]|nr:chromatin assembly factor 1 subunit A-domain-containing protein [Pelagophyceae sp. CCMP2097]
MAELAEKCESYQAEMRETVRASTSAGAEEADYRLAYEAALPDEGKRQGDLSDDHVPMLARLIQGSAMKLDDLASEAASCLASSLGAGSTVDAAACAAKIKLIAQRKAYGISSSAVVINEDDSAVAMWRWEVQTLELFDPYGAAAVKAARLQRVRVGKKLRALGKLVDVLRSGGAAAKVSQEEEKYAKFVRDDEAARLKALAAQRTKDDARKKKDDEAQRKKDEALAKKEEKEAEKKRKVDAKAALKPEAAPKKKRNSTGSDATAAQKNLMAFNFVKPKAAAAAAAPRISSTPEGQDSSSAARADENGAFLDALLETRARPAAERPALAGLRSALVAQCSLAQQTHAREWRARSEVRTTVIERVDAKGYTETVHVTGRVKHLHFHHEVKPPFHGPLLKQSATIAGRRPFARDDGLVDYDHDSDAEWAANALDDDGEDVSDAAGDDDDDDGDDDGLDYDDGFLRGDDDMDGDESHGGKPPSRADKPGAVAVFGPFFGDDEVPDDVSAYTAHLVAQVAPPPPVVKAPTKAAAKKAAKTEAAAAAAASGAPPPKPKAPTKAAAAKAAAKAAAAPAAKAPKKRTAGDAALTSGDPTDPVDLTADPAAEPAAEPASQPSEPAAAPASAATSPVPAAGGKVATPESRKKGKKDDKKLLVGQKLLTNFFTAKKAA